MLRLVSLPSTLSDPARTTLQAPPFHASLAGGSGIFAGIGNAAAIDWQNPVAWLFADAALACISYVLPTAQRHILAVRNVSAAGTAEHSTHLCAAVRLEGGELASTFLPLCHDLQWRELDKLNIAMAFTSVPSPGETPPAGYEILIDDAGSFDSADVLATVPAADVPGDIRTILTLPRRPCRLAVRAVADTTVGPLSRPLDIPARYTPAPPQLVS
jgi:hypothetical protein